jgi:hypothetical protein
MNLKQRRLIGHFLEMLKKRMEKRVVPKISSIFLNYFTRPELIDMVLWLYSNYDKAFLSEKSDKELLELIGDDMNVLSYTIERWNESITATPTMSQTEVHKFFNQIQIDPHYLRDKPIGEWDEYDRSNYYSILFKHGKTRRVFAIFTSSVKNQDKYIVTSPPKTFYDTKEEAETELKRCIEEEKFKEGDLKILSLWKIN